MDACMHSRWALEAACRGAPETGGGDLAWDLRVVTMENNLCFWDPLSVLR